MRPSREDPDAERASPPATPCVRALYVHVPFCRRICPYCDFAVHRLSEKGPSVRDFIAGIRLELPHKRVASRLKTVYFGGGTPSSLAPDEFSELARVLAGEFDHSRVREFTVECNPEDVTPELATAYARAGVTRVSLGAQSFEPSNLRLLGRRHDAECVERAIAAARDAGIRDVGLDLIFAAPGAGRGVADRDLDAIERLRPDHVSTYLLTFEPGTPFTRARDRGSLVPLADEDAVALLHLAASRLAALGYERYEVSNHALPGRRSLHNVSYWRDRDYLGLGPSAASHLAGSRLRNERALAGWLGKLRAGMSPVAEVDRPDVRGQMLEALMLGLRTRVGLRLQRLRARFGDTLDWLDRDALEGAIEAGLVVAAGDSLRPTARGLDFADGLAVRLLADHDPAGRQP